MSQTTSTRTADQELKAKHKGDRETMNTEMMKLYKDNGANPISIVVPCHRVIGSDGSLTGYAGGLERKRWLLAHEEPAASVTGRLF